MRTRLFQVIYPPREKVRNEKTDILNGEILTLVPACIFATFAFGVWTLKID